MTYLYLWMALAGAGDHHQIEFVYGWHMAGTYSSAASCEKAAANLGMPRPEQHRCIVVVSGEIQQRN